MVDVSISIIFLKRAFLGFSGRGDLDEEPGMVTSKGLARFLERKRKPLVDKQGVFLALLR